MITIRCINPECKAPNRKFQWDESKYGEGLAQPHEPGAVRVIAVCPCGTKNAVWVRGLKKDKLDRVMRGGKRR